MLLFKTKTILCSKDSLLRAFSHNFTVYAKKTAATIIRITICIDEVIVAMTSNVVNATIALSVKFFTSIYNDI